MELEIRDNGRNCNLSSSVSEKRFLFDATILSLSFFLFLEMIYYLATIIKSFDYF